MARRLSPEEMGKLPKWARVHINACYQEVECLRREKAAMFGEAPDAPRVILPYFHGAGLEESNHQPLSKWQSVRFVFPDQLQHRNEIEVGIDHDSSCLSVRGDDTIQIEPRAGNSVHIRLGKGRLLSAAGVEVVEVRGV